MHPIFYSKNYWRKSPMENLLPENQCVKTFGLKMPSQPHPSTLTREEKRITDAMGVIRASTQPTYHGKKLFSKSFVYTFKFPFYRFFYTKMFRLDEDLHTL